MQSEQATKLKEELAAPLRVMQEFARRIAKVSKESKLPIDEEEYVSSLKVELMDAVVQWCRGASFGDVRKVRILRLMNKITGINIFTVDRPVRRKFDSRLPPPCRTAASDGTSSQSHR